MKLGVGLGWHSLGFEERLEMVRLAEARGFAAAYVDGDVTQLPSLGDADVLDGWTVTTALLSRTERIAIGSIRLVHHWNAARLAQATATLERLAPGRLRFLVSIGGQPGDRGFGLPFPPARERIEWLAEMLDAVRALWRGESVTRRGRFVTLDGARVRPTPPGGALPVEVAGQGRQLLRVVAAHADRWDVNLPPLAARVERAARHLADACRELGRDATAIERSMWIFVRPGRDPEDPELAAEYRRRNPWFRDLGDAEVRACIVAGSPGACRARLAALGDELGLALVIADLSGLRADATRQTIEDLAPAGIAGASH